MKRNYKKDVKNIVREFTELLDYINDCVIDEFDHNYTFDDTFIFYNDKVLMIDNNAKTKKDRSWKEVSAKNIHVDEYVNTVDVYSHRKKYILGGVERYTDILDFYPRIKKYIVDGFIGIITGDLLYDIFNSYICFDFYANGAGLDAEGYFWKHFDGKDSIMWNKGYTYNNDFKDSHFILILPCEEWAFEKLKTLKGEDFEI